MWAGGRLLDCPQKTTECTTVFCLLTELQMPVANDSRVKSLLLLEGSRAISTEKVGEATCTLQVECESGKLGRQKKNGLKKCVK